MIQIIEERRGSQSVFIKTILDEDRNIKYTKRVISHLYRVQKDDFTYFILYDDDMKPIQSAYQYLNYQMKESPLTSRSQAAVAIRLLYCFLSLYGYNVSGIDETAFRQLLFFLKGINTNPEQYSLETQRSNSTVNNYLTIYRSYFSFAHIHCDALFKSHTVVTSHTFESSLQSQTRKKYDNNLKTSAHNSDTVPKYIGPEDFKRIYRAMLDAGDKQAQLIVHLMYGYGLRLGEVLGLTFEDIQEVRDNGKLVPVLILRNRLSDHDFQYAKNLPHVIDCRQYTSKDYVAAKERIIITYDFFEELTDFLEEYHSAMMEKYPENYEKGRADIVSVRNKPDDNHYIFLNRYGRVLSDQTWNKALRKYFEIAGIPVDMDVRDNNLSHRFRHGFAMFHARFSKHPADILSLQKMLRHRKPSSTMVYYNPTPEDEFKIKTEFQTELYDMIPELKEGLYFESIEYN